MRASFDRIVVIFNPQSSGDGPRLAEELGGLGPQRSVEHYVFTALKPIPLQLDGELLALDPGTPVRIDIAPAALATLG